MKSVTRITVRLSDEGGNTATRSYLAESKAGSRKVANAASVLGLGVEEARQIPVGTVLYSGRYSRDGDFTFSFRTLNELGEFLSDIALKALEETGEYNFDGDRVTACISSDGKVGPEGGLI